MRVSFLKFSRQQCCKNLESNNLQIQKDISRILNENKINPTPIPESSRFLKKRKLKFREIDRVVAEKDGES